MKRLNISALVTNAVLFSTVLVFSNASVITHVSAQQQTQQPAQQKAPTGPRVQTLRQLQQQQQRQAQQQAQSGQPAPPKEEVIASHGKWEVRCSKTPAAAPAQAGSSGKGDALAPSSTEQPAATAPAAPKRTCGLVQVAEAPERKGVNLTLVMGKAQQADKEVIMMRIMVPVGVYLPLGIAMEVDGSPIGRVPFIRCLPQICMALAEATTETLAKMRKGSVANFIIYEAPGVGVTLPVSLSGFTKSVDALNNS